MREKKARGQTTLGEGKLTQQPRYKVLQNHFPFLENQYILNTAKYSKIVFQADQKLRC